MTSIISPLRYPGSKRRLAKYIARILEANNLQPGLYVEPFAGGASVALQLLNDGRVHTIGLIERDPLVHAFWRAVFSKSHIDWLIDQIHQLDITIEEWQRYKAATPTTIRQRALTCLFLNRTSFSGIIAPSGGPLGGYDQQSNYPIDCRFTKDTIVKRIRQANALRDRVAFVWKVDWKVGLRRIAKKQQAGKLPQDVFYYFDPPFFNKAKKLYNHYFTNGDHTKLRDAILDLSVPWILSYDNCDQVDRLYQNHVDPTHVDMLYSVAQNGGSRTAREVILTNNLAHLPAENRLYRTAAERQQLLKKAKPSTAAAHI